MMMKLKLCLTIILFIILLSTIFSGCIRNNTDELQKIAENSLRLHPRIDHPHRPSTIPNPPGNDFVQGVPSEDIELTALFPVSVTTGENGGFDIFNAVNPADVLPGNGQIPHFYSGVNFRKVDTPGDRYLLGDHDKVFFLGRTSNIDHDFARIIDMDRDHSEIVLHGKPDDYILVETNGNEPGTAIFYNYSGFYDMIGFIADISIIDTSDDIFSYVNNTNKPSTEPVLSGIDQIGGKNADLILAVEIDDQGNTYAVGVSNNDLTNLYDVSQGQGQLFALKYDDGGNLCWIRQFGSDNGVADFVFDMTIDETSLYAVGRYLSTKPFGLKDAFIVKINLSSGVLEKEALWEGQHAQFAGTVTLSHDYVYVSGIGKDPDDANQEDQDPYIEKRKKSDLSLVKRITFGAGTNKEPWGGLFFDPDKEESNEGVVYCSGWVQGDYFGDNTVNGGDVWLIAFDQDLNMLWVEQWGSSQRDWTWDLTMDDQGYVYVVGHTYADIAGNDSYNGLGDGFISKFDPNKNQDNRLIWSKTIGTEQADEIRNINCYNNSLYICGYTFGSLANENAGRSDVWAAQLDLEGNQLFTTQFGTEMDERSFLSVSTHGFFIGGFTEGSMITSNKGFFDGYLLKLELE